MNAIGQSSTALHVVSALFHDLNEERIRYCHWKSTHRLADSLAGKTDLDLLVDREDSQRFYELLHRHDFKRFISHPHRQFPAIEDYLGFDPSTGRLIHLHIHYRLVLGEQFVKNYYLPLEQPFLEHTYLRRGVPIPVPELELIVLVLRALLKYRDRDVLRDMLRLGRSSGIPRAILGECLSLLHQTNPTQIAHRLEQDASFISSDLIFHFLDTIQRTPRAGWTLYRLRSRVRRDLAPYQRYSRRRARAIYYRVMLSRQWPLDRILARLLRVPDKRKTPASGGMTIAFIGADGAGKSTIVQQIVTWLSWRMVVRSYYMGSNQPSRRTRALKQLTGLAQLVSGGCRRVFGPQSRITRLADRPRRFLEQLRYLADGRDRYRRYLHGRRSAAQGAIVIYDRYPLDSVRLDSRIVDGPRIAATGNGHLGAVGHGLAQAEAALYRNILPPEHLFALHVSPDVSQQRKPTHQRAAIEAKSAAIERIAQTDGDLTHIDAEQPLDEVILRVKAALWKLL
ncbi:MAG TPA: hypothetical protein VFZ66_26070 [Herpetosiphonaceae bacterium]